MKNVKAFLTVSLAVLSIGSTEVFADGFLAGFARDVGIINEEQRQQLDGAHASIGQPLDQVGAQIITSYTGIPMGHMCVTPVGAVHAAIQPMGTPCSLANGGYIYYGVIQ